MPPASEAPPPYSEEPVASPPPSQPSLSQMPEPDADRGSQCGSQVGGGSHANSPNDPNNPNNNGVVFTLPRETDEDMNKAMVYWIVALILLVVGWVIFPTFLCLWPIALVLAILGYRHCQASNARRVGQQPAGATSSTSNPNDPPPV